jgi:hypothetical protein
MFQYRADILRPRFGAASSLLIALVAACSSNTAPSTPDAALKCANPGQPTPGPADDHCSLPDGGTRVQTVDRMACNPVADSGDDGGSAGGDDGGGAQACPWGATMYGTKGNDDDCKYHVEWSSTPICEGSVALTAVATYLSSGQPVAGAGLGAEVFTTTPGDWDADSYCDTLSTHLTPTGNGAIIPLTEGPAGTYTGSFVLDQAGQWTVRLHFFETYCDVPASPHGHAAFHITVP